MKLFLLLSQRGWVVDICGIFLHLPARLPAGEDNYAAAVLVRQRYE
jgi:hypothetical protein